MLQKFKHVFFKPPKKKIGLALGSGGAKGLAHIGVIKVLERNNIPIDCIAGTSAGALIGGAYAKTKDIDKIEDIIRESKYRDLIRTFFDPTRSPGLVKGQSILEFLEEKIGTADIKDLNIPFQAVATDIKTGNSVIFDKGDLLEAIRASISIPILLTPVSKKDKILIDGAFSDPIPANVVKKMGADIVIAVNLNNESIIRDNKKINSISMTQTIIDLFSYNLSIEKVKEADIVINPKTTNVSWLKFAGGIDLIQKGEEATLEVLPEIKKLVD